MSRRKSTIAEARAAVSPIAERLGQLRLKLAEQHPDFTTVAKYTPWLKVPNSTYASWEAGDRKIKGDELSTIAERTGANPIWLLTGKGPMLLTAKYDAGLQVAETPKQYRKSPKDEAIAALRRAEHIIEKELQNRAISKGPDIVVLPPHVSATKYEEMHPHVVKTVGEIVPIPILAGAIAAGAPTEVFEQEIEDWAFCYRPHIQHPDSTSAVHVRGDSMEPHICDGGLVGVDHAIRDIQSILRARQPLAAVRDPDGHGVLVRWAEVEDHIAIFKPTNKKPGYPTVIWDMKDHDAQNPIVGMVVFKYGANR